MNTLSNNRSLQEMSLGPGNYRTTPVFDEVVYPWAPTTRLQKMGGSIKDESFVDTDSELKNITRSLTNDPSKKYVPGKEGEKQKMLHYEDGFFHQESSRLTNNAFELKEYGINRWESLFFNPQKNCIEPFRRIGENSVLNALDTHVQSQSQN